jgi:hypothetical protein
VQAAACLFFYLGSRQQILPPFRFLISAAGKQSIQLTPLILASTECTIDRLFDDKNGSSILSHPFYFEQQKLFSYKKKKKPFF